MSSYTSQREKVKEFFMKSIYPKMDSLALDYHKIVSIVSSETGTSKSMVEDVLISLKDTGIINLISTIELPQEELEKRINAKQELIQKEIKEAGL